MLRFGLLTISDRAARGERPDASGPALEKAVTNHGWQVVHKALVADELPEIKATLISMADSGEIDVILTTGGTGFGVRDVTPEATSEVIDRNAPGLAEAMRAAGLRVTPHAMLTRGLAGLRGRTLVINLPGSPKAAVENFQVVAPVLAHAIQLLKDDPAAETGHQF